MHYFINKKFINSLIADKINIFISYIQNFILTLRPYSDNGKQKSFYLKI